MTTESMVPDEKKGVAPGNEVVDETKVVKEPVSEADLLQGDIRRALLMVVKSLASRDLRLMSRAVRLTASLRPRILTNPQIFVDSVALNVPESYTHREALLATIDRLDFPENAEAPTAPPSKVSSVSNDLSAYIHFLVLAVISAKRDIADIAAALAITLLAITEPSSRASLHEITAQSYHYLHLASERTKSAQQLRPVLLEAYRTATLRHNRSAQAVLINLLLRNYTSARLYDLADKLISNAPFPEVRSNNQLARYLYYVGRIRAVQLDYSEAFSNLSEALRKAPQGNKAVAFRTNVQKFVIVVQLLMGEIPDLEVFQQRGMRAALAPYLRVTRALRIGDLGKYEKVVEEESPGFAKDETLSLVRYLHHNVIKTGLRKISASYTRISIADIASKLSLESAEDAECIVAKAIRDGVVDATIDHDGGFVRSKENFDTYSTIEPTNAFHNRISFCLKVHNEAVRAMRFPDPTMELETPEARRERIREEMEFAKTLAEAEEEDDEDY